MEPIVVLMYRVVLTASNEGACGVNGDRTGCEEMNSIVIECVAFYMYRGVGRRCWS